MPFVDALVADRFELAFRHIRAGQSPDAPIAYRDDTITAGRELMLTPLVMPSPMGGLIPSRCCSAAA